MARRRLAAASVLLASTASLWLLLAPAAGHAQEPDISAWWSAANLGDPAPAPPAPPDVADGDLLVQGSNAGGAPSTPLGAAPASSQAIAGLRFDLQPTDVVGALRLTVDGDPPPQVSIVACRATEAFGSASNGAWSKVPRYDGDTCVDSKLDGDAVVFADATTLVADAQLAVVILPGAVDRVVFKPPDDDTLEVTHAGSVGQHAPDFGAGAQSSGEQPPAGGGGAAAPPQSSVGGTDVVAPPTTPDLPGGGTVEAPESDQAPVLAESPAPTSVGTRPTAATTDGGLSTGQRRAIALVVIAAEIAGYALLTRTSAGAAVPAAAVAGMASGRLRPPDRAVGGFGRLRSGDAGAPGGVGRFRRDRQGPAPHL